MRGRGAAAGFVVAAAVSLTACVLPRESGVTVASSAVRGVVIDTGKAVCAAPAPDTDGDGLGDSCELALAAAFAPLLVVAPNGCNWDDSVTPARLGGEYYFGVQPDADGAFIRIAYLPAYYRDCGWRGAKCWLPFVDCAPHAGDSEAIVLAVVRGDDPTLWHTEAVFLSAHCFGRMTDGCRWYRGEDLDRFRWVEDRTRAAPVVWVAEGRQANYASRADCDRGHASIDTCDRNRTALRFPIRTPRQNIGSRGHPIGSDGCVTGEQAGWGSAVPTSGAVECFWRPESRFHGWQPRVAGAGATPYARYLEAFAGF